MVWIQLAAGLLAYSASADSASIFVPLQRTGVDRNAGGQVSIRLGATNSSMTLLASNLTAGRRYALLVGGVVQGQFVAAANGRGQLRYARPAAPGAAPFDFDPRGRQCLLIEEGRVVLRARISGPGEPRGSVVSEEVRLPRLSGAGRADAEFELLADGSRRFAVSLTNAGDGTFTVFVNGIRRGNMVVSGGSGSIEYDNDSATAGRSLNFDPRGMVIDIIQGGILRFSGEFRAKADGISTANPAVITRLIPPTTVSPSSIALARRWVDHNARREFDVELFNVPQGIYELYVQGRFRGFIPVIAGATGSFGEMQFSSDADDEDEQRLDFEPFTSFYTILGPDGLFFEGEPLRGGVQLTNLNIGLDIQGMPSEIELPLFNLGADANATARAQVKTDDQGRRHFEVEVRNVPPEDYTLTLNGVPFGTIEVVADANGTGGVIEYEDEPELGELLLGFDPLGKEVGIVRGRTRYFQRVLPVAP